MPARGPLLARSYARAASKAGFTLLEMLLVLAIMGLSAAIVVPRIGASLDQAESRTEYFKFQQQVLDLRRQTYHEEQSVKVVNSGDFVDDPDADPTIAEVQLGQGWSYKLSDPLIIDGGGLCSPTTVDLINQGRTIMRLQGASSCRFVRVIA